MRRRLGSAIVTIRHANHSLNLFSMVAGAGIVVLVTRLCQTSLMVLCERQAAQAGFASAITLVAINIQREARPYRRTSE